MTPPVWPELAGDPEAIRQRAATVASAADGLGGTSVRLRQYVLSVSWQGLAAQQFIADALDIARDLGERSDAAARAAQAIRAYAAALEQIQAEAARAYAAAAERARQAAADQARQAAGQVGGRPGVPIGPPASPSPPAALPAAAPAVPPVVLGRLAGPQLVDPSGAYAQRVALDARLAHARAQLDAALSSETRRATPLLDQMVELAEGAGNAFSLGSNARDVVNAVKVQDRLHGAALRAEAAALRWAWSAQDTAAAVCALDGQAAADAKVLREAMLGASRYGRFLSVGSNLLSVPGDISTLVRPEHGGLVGVGDRAFAAMDIVSGGIVLAEVAGVLAFAPEVAVGGAVLGAAAAAWTLGEWVFGHVHKSKKKKR